jgi:phenylalanyl-tRNA synthetase beta chain
LSRLGINNVQTKPISTDVFAEGIAFANGNNVLVEFGTVKKSILKHFDIKQEVVYADFDWNAVLKSISNKIKFVEIPKYPEVRRDLALLIDNTVSFQDIVKSARNSERKHLQHINLFDIYEGEKLPQGKKSYAVSFNLIDEEKTMTDSQIESIMNKLINTLNKELNAELRS